MFFPLGNKPFIVPAALPGDDLMTDMVAAFWQDGSKGPYIHLNIWHEGSFLSRTTSVSATTRERYMPRSIGMWARNLASTCSARCARTRSKADLMPQNIKRRLRRRRFRLVA
nr:hypothetical protein [Leisingera methylohalidivorans]